VARANKKPKPEFDVLIEGFSHDGRGVGRIQGKAVFVAGALLGEQVRAQLVAKNRHFDEAKVLEIISRSPDRVEPRCPHFGICSGCVLQHLSAEKQIEVKQTTLLDNLQRIGHVQPQQVLPVLTADAWGYRRKGRFSVRYVEKKAGVLVGFREINPRFVADLKQCNTIIPELSQLIGPISQLIGAMHAKQEIRQVEFIAGNGLIALVFRNFVALDEPDLALLHEFELLHAVQIYLQPGDIHTVFPLQVNPQPLSFELVRHGINFQFQPLDFIQVNAKMNEAMIDQSIDLLAPKACDVVLDLFCGLGNFTLPLAKLAGEVVGVEGDQKLVDRAKQNA
jgi:23S rRNA (uracil1939-C5)-methyltransferase